MGQIVTPDFAAGLLIGSFGVYACWLLSLRLAEPIGVLTPEEYVETLFGEYALPACPECRPDEPHFADCPVQADRIGDALVLLDKAFSDE